MAPKQRAILESLGEELPYVYTSGIHNPKRYDKVKETYATKRDGHFLLCELFLGHEERASVFGVVCGENAGEADRRLYERARDFINAYEIDDRTGHRLVANSV